MEDDNIKRDSSGRFPPGQSGNSRGRPRNPTNVGEVILKAANAKVAVGPSRKRTRKLDLAATQLANKGAQGEFRHQKLLFEMAAAAEKAEANAPADRKLTRTDEEIVTVYLAEYRRHLEQERVA